MASPMLLAPTLCPHDLAVDVDGDLGDGRPLEGRIRRLGQLHRANRTGSAMCSMSEPSRLSA